MPNISLTDSEFWINDKGEHPNSSVLITKIHIQEGVWKPVDPSLLEAVLEYLNYLESLQPPKHNTFPLCERCNTVANMRAPDVPFISKKKRGRTYYLTCSDCEKHWCCDECAIEDKALKKRFKRLWTGERVFTCQQCIASGIANITRKEM